MQQRGGFTLIELLVVIAIIGILSAGAVISFSSQQAKARDARRQQDLDTINTTLQNYINDHTEPKATIEYGGGDVPGAWDYSSMPTAGTNGGPFMKFLSDEGYINKVPLDPINDYSASSGQGFAYGYNYYQSDPAFDKDVSGTSYKTYTLRTLKTETGSSGNYFGYVKIPVVPR